MVEINDHVILSHMDTPSRIFLWQASQVLTCSVPFALGLMTDHYLIGFLGSALSVYGFKRLQERFGKGKLKSLLYWTLPTPRSWIRKGVPPSFVRFWVK